MMWLKPKNQCYTLDMGHGRLRLRNFCKCVMSFMKYFLLEYNGCFIGSNQLWTNLVFAPAN